jgi:hypothetical protein
MAGAESDQYSTREGQAAEPGDRSLVVRGSPFTCRLDRGKLSTCLREMVDATAEIYCGAWRHDGSVVLGARKAPRMAESLVDGEQLPRRIGADEAEI